MFAVIYSFTVHPNQHEEFEKAWSGLTGMIYRYEGSLGSRLHRRTENEYIAYAQWPDRKTWKSSGDNLPPKAETFRDAMRSSCSHISTLMELDVKIDMLKDQPFPL